jgi:ABC-type lipoprotein release transport system permease subunit
MRTLLSVVTLTLSVTALIAVSAASSTVESVVRQSAIQEGGVPSTILVSGFAGSVGLSESAQLRDQLARVFGPDSVGRSARLESIAIDHAGTATPLDVLFVDPELRNVYQYVVREGAWVDDGDTLAVHAVVNELAADQLGLSLGESFSFRVPGSSTQTSAEVSGVVDDGAQGPRVFAAIAGAEAMLRANSGSLSTELVVGGDQVDASQVQARLAVLGGNYRSTTFETQQTDVVQRRSAEIAATSSAFRLVGLLSLFVGIIGLANIGLAGVREQSAELSLRRAMGARWWHLPVVMLLETQLIAIVATGFAVLVSSRLYPLIARRLAGSYGIATTPFPWRVALVGLALSALAAAVAGLAPAVRSLRVRISSVMRAE